MREFKDKVAVITGAAEGIGKAIATEAARRGMKLVLADINAKGLEQTAAEFVAGGTEVLAQRTDVSDDAQVEALAEAAYARFGAVHLLVNNAGVAVAKTAWETTRKDWDWVMGVNFYGVTNGLHAFVPRMLAGGEEGHIVNVASIAGMLSVPGMAAYNASKFAVVTVSEGMFHDLALRHAKLGVSVLCPGWVKTRIAEAERHRAPDERTNLAQLDPATLKTGLAVRQAVDAGIAPAAVAEMVFQAVEEGRFYILTHPHTRGGIKIRMEDILQDRAPTLLPF